jgi:hypothetical protein
MSKVGCNITDAAKKSESLKSKSKSSKQVTLKQVSTSQSGGPMVMAMERRLRDLSISVRDGLYKVPARWPGEAAGSMATVRANTQANGGCEVVFCTVIGMPDPNPKGGLVCGSHKACSFMAHWAYTESVTPHRPFGL